MKTSAIGLVLAAGTAVAGCGASPGNEPPAPSPAPASADPAPSQAEDVKVDNEAADRAFHMLTKIDLGNRHTFSIYEPSPGEIVYGEAGPSSVVPIDGATRRLSPVEIFQRLSPDAPVPTELFAAEERQAQVEAAVLRGPRAPAVALGSAESAPPAPEQVLDATGPCADAWFSSNFCISSADWDMCLLDWWDGAWARTTGDFYAGSIVCPISPGDVVLNVSSSTGAGGIWTVSQGFFRRFDEGAAFLTTFTLFSQVTNAGGHKFQFSSYAYFL
jgi:hypothetical protein